ncbi:hypothetical protein [Kocuria rosea]|uniref:hypothetical protein n=1 Tax=Kocuria rosea TaxID=1275 RepID=UPI001ABF0725|nr:hypothetical protein [Kocuria rosea]
MLKFARQPYYRWLAAPITVVDVTQVYRMNALFDAHHDETPSSATASWSMRKMRPAR